MLNDLFCLSGRPYMQQVEPTATWFTEIVDEDLSCLNMYLDKMPNLKDFLKLQLIPSNHEHR